MRTERRPAPSSPSRTTGTSAPTDRITVTAVMPRFIRRRAPSPTRRPTACRARLRYARPSRNGLSARQLELGAAPDRRSRLRGHRRDLAGRRPSSRHAGRTGARRRGRRAAEGRTSRRMAGTAANQPRGARRRPRALAAAAEPAARLGGAATLGNRTWDEQRSGRGRSGARPAQRRPGRPEGVPGPPEPGRHHRRS